VTVLEEKAVTEGDITCFNGTLYVTQMDDDFMYSDVIAIDLQTMARTTLGAGYALERSGSHLAVKADKEGTSLKVYDLTGAAEPVTVSSAEVNSIVFSKNGEHLYYTVSNDRTDYPQTLYRYDLADGKTTQLADVIQANLYQGIASENVILVTIYSQQGTPVPVTYVIAGQ